MRIIILIVIILIGIKIYSSYMLNYGIEKNFLKLSKDEQSKIFNSSTPEEQELLISWGYKI